MGGVAFLPEELTGSDEGCRVLEFPSDHVCPLVEAEGQVPVGVDPLGVARVHNSFTGGSNGDGLREDALSGLGHPGYLRSKSLDMIFLLTEGCFSDKHGEVAVLDSYRLEEGVQV